MNYINELLLIFKYSGEMLINVLLLAFEAKLGELNKLSKKLQKVLIYLNNNTFCFGAFILKITGVKLFKYAMKFLESNSGIIAHEIYFEMIEWKYTIIALKSNITIEFADAI
jgi:hypothetical protein